MFSTPPIPHHWGKPSESIPLHRSLLLTSAHSHHQQSPLTGIEKHGTGRGKKSGVKAKLTAWVVRTIGIAKLDRAVQEDPSRNIPADNPGS
jgi:hypothetical protein